MFLLKHFLLNRGAAFAGISNNSMTKKKRGLKYVYRTLSPDATLAILGTLGSDNAMAVKTSFKK